MIPLSLNRLQAWSTDWLVQGQAVLQTMGQRLVTWGQPLARIPAELFSRDNLSQVAQRLVSLLQDSVSEATSKPEKKGAGGRVELYSPQGAKWPLDNRGRGKFNPTDFRSRWPRNAYDLDLSQTARLAHGIATHTTAPDNVRKNFVQHVLEARKQGGYDEQTFIEARQLLNLPSDRSDTRWDG
ncbi:MAG: hypothetical protein HW380_357 [Magnetococcales bacterium]|nr:hypothetical protein [Magnetococcales bacterium]HIJ83034.1 hypothetical protein [Magnetococcales bacterium]